MQPGPKNTKLSLAELVEKAKEANLKDLNALFAGSNDPQFLMKFSATYPAAKQRLIDNFGSWKTHEKEVLSHLSKQGYVDATRKLYQLGEEDFSYQEVFNFANEHADFCLSVYLSSQRYLALEDWVKVAKNNKAIAEYLISELYRFIVYGEKPIRNKFEASGEWSQSKYTYESSFTDNLYILLDYHPSLAQSLFNDGFKIFDDTGNNYPFHRLCETNEDFVRVVFKNAARFSLTSLIKLAQKHPVIFLEHSQHILELSKFQDSIDLKDVLRSIEAVIKIIENAPKEPEVSTITTAFDNIRLSGNKAPDSVAVTSDTKAKQRRASC